MLVYLKANLHVLTYSWCFIFQGHGLEKLDAHLPSKAFEALEHAGFFFDMKATLFTLLWGWLNVFVCVKYVPINLFDVSLPSIMHVWLTGCMIPHCALHASSYKDAYVYNYVNVHDQNDVMFPCPFSRKWLLFVKFTQSSFQWTGRILWWIVGKRHVHH